MMKKTVIWGIFFSLFLTAGLFAADVTQYGAKIAKGEMAPTDTPVLTLPDGWRLLDGEVYTGLNNREYYFTIEKEGKDLEPPVVEAAWPNVEIAAVYGAADFERTDAGCRFRMKEHRTPTAFKTELHFGELQMHFQHNVEGLQGGLFRDKPYPKGEIAANQNFLFASREMLREIGLMQPGNPIDAVVLLSGFETNFPNGHDEYPPHFHIIMMWDNWQCVRCPHFYLSPDGKVLYNKQYNTKIWQPIPEQCKIYQPGEDVGFTDRSGEVKMILTILTDGSGLMMKIPGSEKEYKVSSENAVESVAFSVRADSSAPWEVKSVTRVNDDSLNGVLTVETERNGQVEKEEWRYNPHTGDLIE